MVFLGLWVSALSAGISTQEMHIKDFVRQMHVEGVPYDSASTYTAEVVPTLVEMLRDENEAPHWGTIAVTLCIIGDVGAFEPLVEFIEADHKDIEGGQSHFLRNTKADAVMALGYLVNRSGDEKALNYLLDATRPDFWSRRVGVGEADEADFSSTRAGSRLSVDTDEAEAHKGSFSSAAILGLALSGKEEAKLALDKAGRRTDGPVGIGGRHPGGRRRSDRNRAGDVRRRVGAGTCRLLPVLPEPEFACIRPLNAGSVAAQGVAGLAGPGAPP